MSTSLTPNALAFIGLCNEYCAAIENARESTRQEFVASMLRLLPRIYISATDLYSANNALEECYIDTSLDEEYYDAMRRNMEHLMGPDDSYLEVFEDDMKYSDTPIVANISENLADLFQVCYEFVETIRDAPDYLVENAIQAVSDDFGSYWSRILCNVLRALNHVRYNSTEQDF
ncbi:MAG: DUF5063 domain-containing protein [Paramuribaculum sp.]|nr:DUF5063 domain-containing protein [Paramuribaculum sp.]